MLVGRAVTMAVRWGLDPHFYVYPPLGLWAFAAVEWLLGFFAPGRLGSANLVDPSSEYLAARMVSVLAFTAATGLVGLAGRAAYGTAAGVLAALAFAVAPLAVQQAHFGRVDLLATAFIAAAIWLAGRATDARGWALAGVAAGLAAGTKYTAGVVIVYVVLLALLRPGPNRLRRPAVVLVAAVIAFLVVMAPVGHPLQQLEGLQFLGGRAQGGYRGLPLGLIYHPTTSLPAGLGPGEYLVCLAGLALGLWRRRPVDLALGGYLGACYLSLGFSHEVFFRYVLPMLPALCLLAGGLLRDAGPLRSSSTLVAGVAGLLLLPSAATSIEGDRLLTMTDTRVLAAAWLDAHAPPVSELRVSTYWSEPVYDRAAIASEPLHPIYLSGDPLADTFQLGRYSDHYVINQPESSCYRFDASGPPWQSPPPAPPGNVLATFLPYSPGEHPSGVYDPLDSFFLPVAGFAGLERPGPSIVISAC